MSYKKNNKKMNKLNNFGEFLNEASDFKRNDERFSSILDYIEVNITKYKVEKRGDVVEILTKNRATADDKVYSVKLTDDEIPWHPGILVSKEMYGLEGKFKVDFRGGTIKIKTGRSLLKRFKTLTRTIKDSNYDTNAGAIDTLLDD